MKVDRNHLKCRDCGTPVPNPGYRLSVKQAACRLCLECRAKDKRRVGRIPMLRNAAIPISNIVRQVTLGSVLGDGHLERPPPGSINWGLGIKHGLSQTTYAKQKALLLGSLVSKIDYPLERIRVRTVKHPYFTSLAQLVIQKGVKTVPVEMIEKLEPLALAIWYMDDGSLHVSTRKSGKQHALIRIATFSFTSDENTNLRDFLHARFGVVSRPWKSPNPRKPKTPYEGIAISGKPARLFLSITAPYAVGMGLERKWKLHGILNS